MGESQSQEKSSVEQTQKLPSCCAERLQCMLPVDKTMYCILTSAPVHECCSSMRVLPNTEQDPTPEGMCHPAKLRVEHRWSDLNDRTGLMKFAFGELDSEGIRY